MWGSRKKRPMRPFLLLSLLSALAFAAGCSNANTPGSGRSHIDASGKSVSGWVVVPTGGSHTGTATQEFSAGSGSFSCTQCHGADLSGGINGVSCFGNPAGCHHDPVPNWAPPPAVHGADRRRRLRAAPGSSPARSATGTTSPVAVPEVCVFYLPPRGRAAPACAQAAWRGSPPVHPCYSRTRRERAGLCPVPSHTGSPNNPANHWATPPPRRTAPGCFNNTLCHAEAAAPHPVGASWVATSPAAQPHGISAKATPGRPHGFTRPLPGLPRDGHELLGRLVGGLLLPVPRGERAACVAVAHRRHPRPHDHGGGERPGVRLLSPERGELPDRGAEPARPCGDGARMLQRDVVPRPPPWFPTRWAPPGWRRPPRPSRTGSARRQTPGAAAGYAYCQVCPTGRGTNFSGGSSGVSCYPCHGASAPHPMGNQWQTAGGYTHRTTSLTNAAVCAYCHFNEPGAGNHPPTPPPAGSTPGCLNGTLCH